jgi:hypothetical protein
MDIRDDFSQWEAELRDAADEPARDRRPLVAAAILPVALAAVIAVGEVALGIAAFVICVLILVLWRAGM